MQKRKSLQGGLKCQFQKKTGIRQIKEQEKKSEMIAGMCLHDGICIFYIAQQFDLS